MLSKFVRKAASVVFRGVAKLAGAADYVCDVVANPGLDVDRDDEPRYGSVEKDPEVRRANVLESLRGTGDEGSQYRRVVDLSDRYRIDRDPR
jgi:hypothetical protein